MIGARHAPAKNCQLSLILKSKKKLKKLIRILENHQIHDNGEKDKSPDY